MKEINPQINEIIEMAWDDQVSFDAIYELTKLTENQVIEIMRTNMKPSSFRMWRKRVTGSPLKHSKKSCYIHPYYQATHNY